MPTCTKERTRTKFQQHFNLSLNCIEAQSNWTKPQFLIIPNYTLIFSIFLHLVNKSQSLLHQFFNLLHIKLLIILFFFHQWHLSSQRIFLVIIKKENICWNINNIQYPCRFFLLQWICNPCISFHILHSITINTAK